MRTKLFSKRNLGFALLVLILGAAFLLQFLAAGVPKENSIPSASSAKPEGRRALRELLLHFEGGSGETAVELWNKPPASLPRRGGILVLPQVPIGFASLALREDGEGAGDEEEYTPPLQGDLFETTPTFAEHHPRHYARFVHQGGILLAPASEEMLKWLEESAEIESVSLVKRSVPLFASDSEEDNLEVELETEPEDGEPAEFEPSNFTWADAHEPRESFAIAWEDAGGLRLDLEELRRFSPLAEQPRAFLQEADAGEADLRREELTARANLRGVILPLGEGHVALLSDLDVFDNQNLAAQDHPIFAVTLLRRLKTLGRFQGPSPILFDEYALGGWTPPGATGVLTRGAVGWITLHLVVLVALLVWRRAWVGPFARDPEVLEGLAPLERTRAEGSLLLRARRYDLLASHLYDGVVGRLERRLLRARTERPVTDPEEKSANPPALDAWRTAVLKRVHDALIDWDPKANLPALPLPQNVGSRAELHQFQQKLLQWEQTVQRRLEPQLKSELRSQAASTAE